MNEQAGEKALNILAELLAREKMHTQILMSIAYPSLTDAAFQDQMQMIELKIAQVRDLIVMQ